MVARYRIPDPRGGVSNALGMVLPKPPMASSNFDDPRVGFARTVHLQDFVWCSSRNTRRLLANMMYQMYHPWEGHHVVSHSDVVWIVCLPRPFSCKCD